MAPLDPQSLHGAKSVGNPALACIGGVAGAVAGALLWAAIAAMTNSHIGWTAIGVGFLVGKAMRLLAEALAGHMAWWERFCRCWAVWPAMS
jgi:hypothetical protein